MMRLTPPVLYSSQTHKLSLIVKKNIYIYIYIYISDKYQERNILQSIPDHVP